MWLKRNYSAIASTFALVVSLTAGGALAASKITSSDIGKGEVKKPDLGRNAVTPRKVNFPKARSVTPGVGKSSTANASVSDQYELVANMGTYDKKDASTVLQLTWTGSAQAGNTPCLFQLRADGQPAAGGGGETYVPNGSAISLSVQGIYGGLSTGPVNVQIYAKLIRPGNDPCTVGPGVTQVAQTVNAVELPQ